MANRYAVASGNWSDTATWDGGTLPTAGDVVRPNGFTVTIDVDVTVDELTNNASAPAVAGGLFVLNAGVTLNADITLRQSAPTGMFSVAYGSGTSIINGDIKALAVQTFSGRVVNIAGQSGGILIVNGSITYPPSGSGAAQRGNIVKCDGTGNGFMFVSNGLIQGSELIGTVSSDVSTVIVLNDYVIELNGIVTGKISTGGNFLSAGVYITGIGNLIINNGLLTGGVGTQINFGPAIDMPNNVNNELRHYGTSIAAINNSAIQGGVVILYDGCEIQDNFEQMAHRPKAQRFATSFMNAEYVVPIDALTNKSFLTAGLLTGYPLESKVEDGTVYGPSSEFEGTLEPWDATFAQALATAQRDLQLPSILSAITAP
jgi:hypothetical protein